MQHRETRQSSPQSQYLGKVISLGLGFRLSINLRFIFSLVLLAFLVIPTRANLVTIPLNGGAESGEYLMKLSLGTPRQEFYAKVTTADYALMLPSEHCTRRTCRTRYSTSSTTYQKVPCVTQCYCPTSTSDNSTTLECGYQELFGSMLVRGTVTRDVGQFNNFTMNYTFVRFDQRPPTLAPDSLADGIFGLSQWEPAYIPEQLLPQVASVTQSTAFSLCLGEFGGKLILGGADQQYFNGNIFWVPISEGQSNFTLDLKDLTVAHLSVTLPTTVYATIDAGTQYLQLPSAILQGVKLLFHDLLCVPNGVGPVGVCGASNKTFFDNVCYIMDDSTINRFPVIVLSFTSELSEKVSLVIPPTNYFVDYGGMACLALEASVGPNVVIGSRIIQEYYTVFVPGNSTVGFAKAVNCSGAQYKAEIVAGNGQQGAVGEKLSHPLVVKVVRLNDSTPVQGINITFNVVDTSIPAEAMWISHAIGMSQPARVSPSFAITSKDGTAETFLWLAGATYETTVSADIPLCLDHVIFTATGQQSYVWRVITYLFLGALVIVVILLNVWYRNAMQRKRFVRRSSVSVNHFEDQQLDSYFIGSPPQSPAFPPSRLDFANADKRRPSRDDIEDQGEAEAEESSFHTAGAMGGGGGEGQASFRTLQWQARRLARRVRHLFNIRDRR